MVWGCVCSRNKRQNMGAQSHGQFNQAHSRRGFAAAHLLCAQVGIEDRRAGPTELDRMKALVAQAMEDGALGVSTSLQYVPDLYNSTDEIIACAKVAASRGGVYFTHQRSEGNRIDSSLT